MSAYFSSSVPPRHPPTDPAGSRPAVARLDLMDVHHLLQRLTSDADPQVVCESLAALLVPALCDEMVADVLVGARLAGWQQNPPVTDGIPTLEPDLGGQTITVHTAGLPPEPDGWTGDLDYVVAFTCRWYDLTEPTGSAAALLKILGRFAAGVVHQAQQSELIQAQQSRIAALESSRFGSI